MISPCRRVTGTVTLIRSEADGDLHFDLRLDPAYGGMLMANNYSEQGGALVVELMPRDHGHLPTVAVGDRVSVTGAYVDDTEHAWSEIHPVWALSINGGRVYRSGPQYGGSRASARSDDAVTACHTNAGASCIGYGGATGSSGDESPGGSSPPSRSSSPPGSSSQVVRPGAFCSPEGARGVTDRGTPMTCKPTATDSRNRWRSSG